jgi:molybdate transport system regulatory protein
MRPKYNLWIEVDDEVVLSTWRVDLLKAIEETGSISAASEEMSVPYRRAWQRIHEMEERFGETLVTTEVGGARGGGAQLTTLAKDMIMRFQAFSSGLDQEVRERFERAFKEFERPPGI